MSKTCSIRCEIVKETDKAILINHLTFKLNGKDMTKSWLPLSQVNEIHRAVYGMSGYCDKLVVSEWIATKTGVIAASIEENGDDDGDY